MDTWQRNANRRRKKTSDNALNVTKKDILPKTKGMQSIKKQKIQEKSDDKDNKKEQGFGDDLEYAWYKRSPM